MKMNVPLAVVIKIQVFVPILKLIVTIIIVVQMTLVTLPLDVCIPYMNVTMKINVHIPYVKNPLDASPTMFHVMTAMNAQWIVATRPQAVNMNH